MLREPIRIGALTLKNRLVMPPMATEKAADGAVTEGLLRFYDEMSAGGHLGLIFQEHSYISPEGKASPGQLSMADDSCVEPLKALVSLVHRNGVPIFAQISHAGSAAKEALAQGTAISPSPTRNPYYRTEEDGPLPREMTQADIDRLIGCFAAAAARAQKAGYDGVEIHSAHGYLLDQFYSPLTNRRRDKYSGATLRGRTQLQVEVIRAVREQVGPDFLISLRWGASDYLPGGATLSEVPEAARIFAEAGIDLLSVSGGMCDFFRPGHQEQGWFAELSEAAKKAADIPVLLAGGISKQTAAEELLAAGKADLIGVGRALLQDPSLPEKWLS